MSASNHWPDHSADLAKMKILIIDDEPVNVALLEEILVEAGYSRFESVLDSRLALQVYKTFQPDLVLLDLMMPPPDGFAILESLSSPSEENFLPVVVLTADTNEKTKRRALEGGATDFLLKPFDHVEVALRIRNILQSRPAPFFFANHRAAPDDALCERASDPPAAP